jgi:hypothetical protein
MTETLIPLAPNLWHVEAHVHRGMHLRLRMTVVRLRSGELWLHSPVAIDDALADRLAAEGPVGHIVAPNRFHYFFAPAAKRRFPQAKLWAAPGLPARRPKLVFDAELGGPAPWDDDLASHHVASTPMWSETVFLHRASRTLVCTDLLFNIHDEPNLASRLLFRWLGVWRKFGTSRLWRWKARGKPQAAVDLAAIAAWDIDRIAMAHGDIVETGGGDLLRGALAPLLDQPAS